MIILVIVLILLSFLAFTATGACNKKSPPTVVLSDYYSKSPDKNGEALESILNNFIEDHKRFIYSPCFWEILNEADKDPNNSDSVMELYTRRQNIFIFYCELQVNTTPPLGEWILYS